MVDVLVNGKSPELILVADLLRKAGADVHGPDDPPDSPDVVVWSSEADGKATKAKSHRIPTAPVVCDIADGCDRCAGDGAPLGEFDLQSVTGLVDTTGFPDGAPARSRVPFIAVSTALHAAAAILATYLGGQRGQIHVSRYLSAAASLTTFLPAGLLGEEASRIGNAHPSSSPWNAYPTNDGWLLICTSKDDQWRKIRLVAGRPELDRDCYAVQAGRVRRRDEVDAYLSDWTRALSTEECARRLLNAGVPAGPIVRMDELAEEPNIKMRQPAFVEAICIGADAADAYQQVALFRDQPLSNIANDRFQSRANPVLGSKPLSGLRVIEIGQFTAVPLAGRHLAHLGANVLKIEPPGGEPARSWTPLLDGLSHYYTISNSGKQVVQLDLNSPDGVEWLRHEVAKADLFIENLRPGVLAKFGLSPQALTALNPNLVVCSVSGFGAHSAYPGRAAFDTVIQAMSGVMDLTRAKGRPVKCGISVADILGAQVALLASLSGLLRGGGRFIDVAMQDVSIYAALFARSELAPANEDMPVRTVREMAANPAFIEHCMTTIPDENGIPRQAVRMPYMFRCDPNSAN